MKKITSLAILAATVLNVQAQDSYFNDQLINNAGDVHGTARFVGMGGALGALGADMSTMNWNPAGIGMFRRSDISITAGAGWNHKGIDEESTTNVNFQQVGAVYCFDLEENMGLRYLNFGINYQKKLDFNNAFYADNMNLRGLSQMSQLAGLANAGFDTDNNLAGMAVDNLFLTPYDSHGQVITDKTTSIHHYGNAYQGLENYYTQKSEGWLKEFSVNISGNVNDRFFWGLTFGVDMLRYRAWNDYFERSRRRTDGVRGDYSLYNDHAIDGTGINMQIGAIIRPFEASPLRIALVAETPTWFHLRKSTLYYLTDNVENQRTREAESYLEYAIRTPWKLRAGVGSTLGSRLAWDVDYEFAAYNYTAMGYPNSSIDNPNSSLFDNTWDKDMNRNTKANMLSTHNVRAGVEFKPISCLALRLGYNYATSAYKKSISLDQINLDSYAMNYATATSFMRMSDVHSVTAGIGYKARRTYIDLAYKYKGQSADFYAFDASSQGGSLSPAKADLSRHQLTMTFGFKF